MPCRRIFQQGNTTYNIKTKYHSATYINLTTNYQNFTKANCKCCIIFAPISNLIGIHRTMKKAFVILLSLLHLVMSTGFAQYTHSCKTMAVKVINLTNTDHKDDSKPCPICAEKNNVTEKKNGCCTTESEIVKTDDVVKQQHKFDFSVKFWGDAIPNKMLGTVFDFAFETSEAENTTPHLSSKIPIRGNPLYIFHCVYRI